MLKSILFMATLCVSSLQHLAAVDLFRGEFHLFRGEFLFSMSVQPEGPAITYSVLNTSKKKARLETEDDIFFSRYVTSPLPERSFYRLRIVTSSEVVREISEWIECADYGSALTIGNPIQSEFSAGERRARQIPLSNFIVSSNLKYSDFIKHLLANDRVQLKVVTTLSRSKSPHLKSDDYIESNFLSTPWFDLK